MDYTFVRRFISVIDLLSGLPGVVVLTLPSATTPGHNFKSCIPRRTHLQHDNIEEHCDTHSKHRDIHRGHCDIHWGHGDTRIGVIKPHNK